MSDNEMRIMIAEKCGWKIMHAGKDDFGVPYEACANKGHVTILVSKLPDYPNDLNAMHEAEKTLTGNQFIEYIRTLKYVCNQTVCPEKWKGNE